MPRGTLVRVPNACARAFPVRGVFCEGLIFRVRTCATHVRSWVDPHDPSTPTTTLGQALYAACMDPNVCSASTMEVIMDIYLRGDGSDTATEAQMTAWKAVNAGAPWADPGPNTYLETCEVADCGTGPWADDDACPELCTFASGDTNTCVPTVTDCATGFAPGDSTCPSSTCPTGCVHTPASKPSTKCQNCINMATVPDYPCDGDAPSECANIDYGVGGPFNCCICAQDQELCPLECRSAPIECVGILKCPGFCPAEQSRTVAEAEALFQPTCGTGDAAACDAEDWARMGAIWQMPDVPPTCADMPREDAFDSDFATAVGCASEEDCEAKAMAAFGGDMAGIADVGKFMCMACIQGVFQPWWYGQITGYDCDNPPAACAEFLANFENGAADCCACYPDEHVEDCPAACKLLPLECKGSPKCAECPEPEPAPEPTPEEEEVKTSGTTPLLASVLSGLVGASLVTGWL